MPSMDLGGGRQWVASRRIEPDFQNLNGYSEDQLRAYLIELWDRAYRAKEPENDRLKTCERYFIGEHYRTPEANRQNTVTNLCRRTVEGVVSDLTARKPRPEVMPSTSISYRTAQDMQEFYTWLMNATAFDDAFVDGVRNESKFGWSVTHTIIDPATGICWPVVGDNFDVYPDPAAKHERDLQYLIIAMPVAVRQLKAMFPGIADLIYADRLASPGYDVYVRPYFEALGVSTNYNYVGASLPARHLTTEAQPLAETSTVLTPGPDAQTEFDSDTAFLLQFFIRDYSVQPVTYLGEVVEDDPTEPGTFMRTPENRTFKEPCCPSGWRYIPMLASGVFPHHGAPLDECFLGLPMVFGRAQRHSSRFFCTGDLDDIIPVNRAYNRRDNLLSRSLEFEAVPVWKAEKDSGVDPNKTTIEPGDGLLYNRGANGPEWMQFKGVASQQFEMLANNAHMIEVISRRPEVQYGNKPSGVETGVAIQALQQAAAQQFTARENPMLRKMSELLKKLAYATGKKAKRPIIFKGTHGRMIALDPENLLLDHDVQFTWGSGTIPNRREEEERVMELFAMGLMDEQSALERLDVKGREEILMRLTQKQMAMMAAQANAAPAEGGGGPPA